MSAGMREFWWTSGPDFRTGSASCAVGMSLRSKKTPMGISSPQSRDFSIAAPNWRGRSRVIFQFFDARAEPLEGVVVIVGDAGTEDVEEGEAFVFDGSLDEFGEVFLVGAESARDERRPGGEGERDGIDGGVDVAEGHALGLHADAAGGRGLSGGEAVDLVVHHDVGEVEIATHGVDEVAGADAKAVAVAARDEDGHGVVGELHAAGYGKRPAVKRVHAVGVDEAGEVGGAADAADRHDFMLGDLEFDKGLLHGGEDSEVPASRTPVGIDFAL